MAGNILTWMSALHRAGDRTRPRLQASLMLHDFTLGNVCYRNLGLACVTDLSTLSCMSFCRVSCNAPRIHATRCGALGDRSRFNSLTDMLANDQCLSEEHTRDAMTGMACSSCEDRPCSINSWSKPTWTARFRTPCQTTMSIRYRLSIACVHSALQAMFHSMTSCCFVVRTLGCWRFLCYGQVEV